MPDIILWTLAILPALPVESNGSRTNINKSDLNIFSLGAWRRVHILTFTTYLRSATDTVEVGAYVFKNYSVHFIPTHSMHNKVLAAKATLVWNCPTFTLQMAFAAPLCPVLCFPPLSLKCVCLICFFTCLYNFAWWICIRSKIDGCDFMILYVDFGVGSVRFWTRFSIP